MRHVWNTNKLQGTTWKTTQADEEQRRGSVPMLAQTSISWQPPTDYQEHATENEQKTASVITDSALSWLNSQLSSGCEIKPSILALSVLCSALKQHYSPAVIKHNFSSHITEEISRTVIKGISSLHNTTICTSNLEFLV